MCYKVKRESEVNITIKKGDIYYADLTPVVGSEQGGIRPVLIIQNDIGNYYSPTGNRCSNYQPISEAFHSYSYSARAGSKRTSQKFGHLAGAGAYH